MAMLNHKRLPETLPLGLLKRLAASPTTNFAVDTCRGLPSVAGWLLSPREIIEDRDQLKNLWHFDHPKVGIHDTGVFWDFFVKLHGDVNHQISGLSRLTMFNQYLMGY